MALAHNASVDINVAAAVNNALTEIQEKYLTDGDDAHVQYLLTMSYSLKSECPFRVTGRIKEVLQKNLTCLLYLLILYKEFPFFFR